MFRIRPFLSSLLQRVHQRIAGSPQVSPIELLAQAPPAIAEELRGREVIGLPPSPPPKQHWMYQLDQHLLLHVYGGAGGRIRRSLPDREALQRDVTLPGLPLQRLTVDQGDRLWLVEDRLTGIAPAPVEVERWFPEASAWLVQLAGPPGPPLRTTPFWQAHQPESIETTPPKLRPAVVRAWDIMGDVAARSLHGDVQPRNLVLGSHGVGLIDWEGFWRYGIPGLDLVFLALMSTTKVPDQSALESLASGKEPPGRPLRSALSKVGLTPGTLHAGLLAMLAIWALGEARRTARNHRPSRRMPFLTMLSNIGPAFSRGAGLEADEKGRA